MPEEAAPSAHTVAIDAVKSDLCRLAAAESRFYRARGHYASEYELRSNGDPKLPAGTRWPYHYGIYVPVPDRFVIVALAYGPPARPPALVIDATLQVCTLSSNVPRVRTLDSPPPHWGDISYDCDKCP